MTADVKSYSVDEDYVFWFYTINGKPNKNATPAQNEAISGTAAEGLTKTLSPGDTVIWQLISPNKDYGFASCDPHHMNEHAKAKAAA